MRSRILPFIFLLYIVAFLDRVNIGFAALTMNTELAITSQQFGFLAGVFFFGYFLLEIPSNLLLHRIGARIWIARILITWGAVAASTGFVQSVGQLYLARFLLGLAEAGFFPGIVLYLTYWFPQRERAGTIALFMTAIPVTNILGAPLSGFILDHVHWLAISSWRWLLILEGLPAVFCGALTFFLLPSRPAEAKFLTLDEQGWITEVLAREELGKFSQHPTSAFGALFLPRVWHVSCIAFVFSLGGYAILFWMPQAVKSLASTYSSTRVGILLMVPWLAGLVVMILVSRSSDRRLERRYHIAIPAVVAGIALMLLGTTNSLLISMALWSFAVMGMVSCNGPVFSLPTEFLAGRSAASGIALVTSIGGLGGFAGPFVIGAVANEPTGIYRGLALTGISFYMTAALALLLPRQRSNR